MADKKQTFKIPVKVRDKYKPAKGSCYKFVLEEEFLRLEADYIAVVDIADYETTSTPDFAKRRIYYSESYRRGTISTVSIEVSSVDEDTQENTYALGIDGIEVFFFEEKDFDLFKEIKDKIEKWNVVG